DNATYVSVAAPFHRQHDARLLPGWSQKCHHGSGQISLFDDETAEPSLARAVVYDVLVGDGAGGSPVDRRCGDGGASERGTPGTATVSWQYKGSSFSYLGGSFRIYADDSRVICWGETPTNPLVFSEVDRQRNDRLDF